METVAPDPFTRDEADVDETIHEAKDTLLHEELRHTEWASGSDVLAALVECERELDPLEYVKVVRAFYRTCVR